MKIKTFFNTAIGVDIDIGKLELEFEISIFKRK